MAIPRFYSILTVRYPNILSKLCIKQTCEHLLIDTNAVLHNCLERADNEDHLLILLKDYICHLIFLLSPSKSVYLAVDGVPPLAKIKEQAFRRMNSSLTSSGLDKNCLTPGTAFMNKLSVFLSELVQSLVVVHPMLEITASGSDEIGEGEQKMMKYMKQYTGQLFVLFSPDADLIVMSLGANENQVKLMRESYRNRFNDTKKKTFELLNIKLLKMKLTESIIGVKQKTVCRDIMLLLMIMGNDFLPTPLGFGTTDSTLQIIIKSLESFYKDSPSSSVVHESSNLINFQNLFRVFQIIHDAQFVDFRRHNPSSQGELQKMTLEMRFPPKVTPSDKKILIKNHLGAYEYNRFKKWRLKQYVVNDIKVKEKYIEIGSEYLQRLQWLFDYYTQFQRMNEFSDFWTFDHNHVPFISDLIIPDFVIKFEDFDKNCKKISTLSQLCLVTPSKSLKLLPLEYQQDSRIRQYSVEDHTNLTFQKLKDMIDYLESLQINKLSHNLSKLSV